ncbi:MAG: hypothetical protein ACXAEF_14390 [Candidatus Thorarchaeota archaeon]
MNKIGFVAVLSILTFGLSIGAGWIATTGNGSVIVQNLELETPYVSGCCALSDDQQASIPFTIYQPTIPFASTHPVVITLQNPGTPSDDLSLLNIELARRNIISISISIPEGLDYNNVTWKGRQLGDVMAYLRDTIDDIEYNYAIIADAESASIAFSMNFLVKHPSAIVTVGYDSTWDVAARIYDGNLLLLSESESPEIMEIVEVRHNLTSTSEGIEYGNLTLGDASRRITLESTQLDLRNHDVITYSTDWILRTLFPVSYDSIGLDEVESITGVVQFSDLISDVLLGGGFILGVIAIVEFRKHQH